MDDGDIPLSGPDISEDDIAAVTAVLRTPRLSLGPKLSEFEEAFARCVDIKHAVAVSSGTAALHLCIRALEIGEGDEVITTPFSFVASANCVLFERAKPVFVDILPGTLCLDPDQVAEAVTRRTKAILGVDVFGYLADWDALQKVAEKRDLVLIEDSCEALGSRRVEMPPLRQGYGGQAGTFADCATFAFYPNKQMTTGEGGMMTTDRDDVANTCRSLRNQGRNVQGGWLAHERLGYNYRLSDIQCALGLSQLRRLPSFIEKRKNVVHMYADALAPLAEYVQTPPEQPGVDVSWFVYVVRLQEEFSMEQRDTILDMLKKRGIGCQNYFPPIHLQPFYKESFGYDVGDFPITESIAGRTIALPFHNNLQESEVQRVAETLRESILRVT